MVTLTVKRSPPPPCQWGQCDTLTLKRSILLCPSPPPRPRYTHPDSPSLLVCVNVTDRPSVEGDAVQVCLLQRTCMHHRGGGAAHSMAQHTSAPQRGRGSAQHGTAHISTTEGEGQRTAWCSTHQHHRGGGAAHSMAQRTSAPQDRCMRLLCFHSCSHTR
jgi:hypothetical protein